MGARFDKDAVAQIVQNLLDNAEKYSRGAADRTLRVELAAEGGDVSLSVLDRGSGVPGAQRRRLFRPFARGADTDAPAGLGLGLALVKALIEAQGGRVSYRERSGGGAVFTVRFPV